MQVIRDPKGQSGGRGRGTHQKRSSAAARGRPQQRLHSTRRAGTPGTAPAAAQPSGRPAPPPNQWRRSRLPSCGLAPRETPPGAAACRGNSRKPADTQKQVYQGIRADLLCGACKVVKAFEYPQVSWNGLKGETIVYRQRLDSLEHYLECMRS